MKRFFLIILLTVLPALTQAQDKTESTFDRIIRTGTIRCGYATWPTNLTKDPNTGQMAGRSYDVMNAVGEKLGLKIDWAEETGWGTVEQGLASKRFDMMCVGMCLDAQRVKRVWYSTPYVHNPVFMFVRADDERFDKNLDALNDPAIKIAVISNTIVEYAAREKFPKATIVDIADLGGSIDLIMAVATGKADAAVNDVYSIDQYNETNGNAVKRIGDPVRYCHGGFMLPQGDMNLKQMIDAALYELNTSSTLRKIYAKYFPDNGLHWLAPALPYERKK